jgi:hypothetical protein
LPADDVEVDEVDGWLQTEKIAFVALMPDA